MALNKCLDISGGGSADGTKIQLWTCNGSGAQNWAAIASLIETCKLNSVNLHAWLADTLRKLVYRWPASLIDELMPWAFTPAPTSMCD